MLVCVRSCIRARCWCELVLFAGVSEWVVLSGIEFVGVFVSE